MSWSINEEAQEAVIRGVKEIIVAYNGNHQDIFDNFRNDEEFRNRTVAFICRCGIDICYCSMGGNRCRQCFVDGNMAHYLMNIDRLRLKDFLIIILCINELLRKRTIGFAKRILRYRFTSILREENRFIIGYDEWENILKTIVNGVITNDEKWISYPYEQLKDNEYVCNLLVKFIIRRGLSISSCLALGHQRYTCFLGDIPSRILIAPDPIRQEEAILIFFHLNASFRKRIAEFMIRGGTESCYCWNNGQGCSYSFIGLSAFSQGSQLSTGSWGVSQVFSESCAAQK
jgi:hypothetical protein